MIRTKSGVATVMRLPQDRVLTETDGPHIKIGNRPAEPTDVREILSFLSLAWGMPSKNAKVWLPRILLDLQA